MKQSVHPKTFLFLFFVLPAFAAGAAGCYNYDPKDLPGYDASYGDASDVQETDTMTDLDSPGQDADSDDIASDWEVPLTCGNGTVDPPGEVCDDGNTDNTDSCVEGCRDAVCGDGFVWLGHEDCDDGNTTPNDGCENDCTFTCTDDGDCMDGDICNGDETCDTDTHTCEPGTEMIDGTVCHADPRSICLDGACELSSCGDGFVDLGGGEFCEPELDANCRDDCTYACSEAVPCSPDGEACNGEEYCELSTSTCARRNALPNGTVCGSDPGVREICMSEVCQLSVCGDSYTDPETTPPEKCDDGNPTNGDGCDNDCTFSCTAATQADDCDDGQDCTDDMCDEGTHTCSNPPSPDTVVCRPAAPGVCDVEETCDGTHPTCPADAFLPATTECRASRGICDVAENCTGTSATCPADTFRPSTYECRVSAGICDVAENCTGDSAICPSNAFRPDTYECRASAGICDVAETCTGSSAECPSDAFRPDTYECRASEGICDIAETCTGSSVDCPADVFRPSTYECRASAGACDVAETCTGSSAACPANGYRPSSYECRASAGICDVAETCTGSSAACPANGYRPSSYECRASAGTCDVAETCTGSSVDCPANGFRSSSYECRASAGVCDVAERCTGSSADCPPDAFRPSTYVCRVSAGQCDVAENCTGSSIDCPANLFAPTGTQCNDNNYCTYPDQCDGLGSCSGPAVPDSAVTAGGYFTCALVSTGGVKCWGQNNYGQLGNGTGGGAFDQSLTPVGVIGLSSGVSAVSTGGFHACALLSTGGVKCWGWNGYGQLGDGTTTNSNTPVDVSGLSSGVIAIEAGFYNTCAIMSTGGLKCWGWNNYGQVGDGTTTDRNTPVDVSGLTSGVATVVSGGYHTCALTNAGGMKCWGWGIYGQLGDGTSTSRTTPVDVSGLTSGVEGIAAGSQHSCALMGTGGVKCWGYNSSGQVGDGTTNTRNSPVNVSGLSSGVEAITAGASHNCALMDTGGLKCWGANGNGRLGDGTTTNRLTPVDVIGLSSSAAAVSGGWNHTCAFMSTGGEQCWGDNGNGQLGDGTTTQRLMPVDVLCSQP